MRLESKAERLVVSRKISQTVGQINQVSAGLKLLCWEGYESHERYCTNIKIS